MPRARRSLRFFCTVLYRSLPRVLRDSLDLLPFAAAPRTFARTHTPRCRTFTLRAVCCACTPAPFCTHTAARAARFAFTAVIFTAPHAARVRSAQRAWVWFARARTHRLPFFGSRTRALALLLRFRHACLPHRAAAARACALFALCRCYVLPPPPVGSVALRAGFFCVLPRRTHCVLYAATRCGWLPPARTPHSMRTCVRARCAPATSVHPSPPVLLARARAAAQRCLRHPFTMVLPALYCGSSLQHSGAALYCGACAPRLCQRAWTTFLRCAPYRFVAHNAGRQDTVWMNAGSSGSRFFAPYARA